MIGFAAERGSGSNSLDQPEVPRSWPRASPQACCFGAGLPRRHGCRAGVPPSDPRRPPGLAGPLNGACCAWATRLSGRGPGRCWRRWRAGPGWRTGARARAAGWLPLAQPLAPAGRCLVQERRVVKVAPVRLTAPSLCRTRWPPGRHQLRHPFRRRARRPPRRGRLAGMLLPGSGGDLSRPSGAWRGSPRRPRGSARSGTWRRCRRSECHAGTGGPSHSARSSRRGAGAGAGPTCPGPGGRPVGEEQVITAESVGGDVGMDLRGRGQRVPVRATPHSARHGRFGAVARRWWRARSRAVRSR